MRREGTPAWMQVVERRLEQAAEEARSRPAKAGIQETLKITFSTCAL